MTEIEIGALEKLREAFPEGTVGILPKPYKRDSQKGKCDECGGFHGLPAVHLDYVGHAAVTDRLLTVDPAWTWEPMALDEHGSPALDREGNLWIRLTVCGITRLGVGDGPNMKERIGDALRNAAMRFGVALSLWTKDELESGYLEAKAVEGNPDAQRDEPKPSRREQHGTVRSAPGAHGPEAVPTPSAPETGDPATEKQLGAISSLFKDRNFPDTERHGWVADVVGRKVASTKDLNKREASKVIEALMALPNQAEGGPF